MSAPSIVRSLPTIRSVALSSLLICSLIGLGASGAFIALLNDNGRTLDDRAGFAVAIPVLTLVLVAPMFIIDLFRKGAFTSMIIVELPVLGVLFILWLADAAWQSNLLSEIQPVCSIPASRQSDIAQKFCTDIQLVVAFGWIAWITLLGYFVTLLTVCIDGAKRDASIWKSSVRECDFGYESSSQSMDKFAQQENESFSVRF
ncbi:hypothetical protein BDY19DRAFT_308432 [Irpex rosettiformis]|uniref:Uncharacterized protein n=1 Tax=Irpex rosettiformis TaxID=378272 RepID=A0ACB8TYZ9_9APHY|nr:hypothetical protein BDY19DRAFT_308432 [Irpex rosettiformis]